MISSPPQRIAELTASGAWGEQTLHGLLKEQLLARPGRVAIKDPANREALTGYPPCSLSWRELDQASDQMALALDAQGLAVGDAVLVQLPNVVELAVLYYAASKLGIVISPVPVQYGRHELASLNRALGARHMITLERFGEADLAAQAREALPACTVLTMGKDLRLDASEPAGQVPAVDDANRILTICWTSGTTGTPKGVPRSHNMWLASGRYSAAAGSLQPDDVLLNPFPLVNMAALGGFLFPAALMGCTLVLHHPLDPQVFLKQLQQEEVNFTIAPPALLNQLAKAPAMWQQFDFGALRRIGSGSAPLAPWMIKTFDGDYGKPIVNFYGSNEGISLFATPESAPQADVRAALFRKPGAGDSIATRVADPASGETLSAPGEQGELLIAGATVFDGYLGHDNEDVFTDDGYFRSGDLVEICGDRGDYYRIVGRCKDIINRGGMKISPAELDLALEQHPALAEAAVCAYADERLGEKICACVVPAAEQATPSLAQLQQYLLEQGFAKFKLPERIEAFTQLSRNPLGKVQRFHLQEAVAGREEAQV